LAWSPDSHLIATGSSDKQIRIWGKNSTTGLFESKSVLEEGHTRTIRSLAWKPDSIGQLVLASGSFDATAFLWQQEEAGSCEFETIMELQGHENEVKCVAWSSDSQFLATCSRDKTIWVWEREDEEDEDFEYTCRGVLSGHTQDVKFVKWHPERQELFSASYDDTIKCWKYDNALEDWICSYSLSGAHSSTVWALDFDTTGKFLVSCSEDCSWIIWKENDSHQYDQVTKISEPFFRSIYSISVAK